MRNNAIIRNFFQKLIDERKNPDGTFHEDDIINLLLKDTYSKMEGDLIDELIAVMAATF